MDTMLRKEKEGSLFKDTKLAHAVMYGCLDEFLKIAQGSPVGELVNQGESSLTDTPLPAGSKKPKGQFPSMPAMPQHDPPAPPEDTEPPQVSDGMNKMQSAMADELCKVAEGITHSEATSALKRLDKLERKKLTREELQRGALTGAIVGPAALAASTLVGGGAGKAIGQAIKKPTWGGRAAGLGKAVFGGGRRLLGAGTSGMVFATGLPTVRRKLDESAEKEKLREYLGVRKRGKLRSKIKRELGV